jgi:hypothetical protein
MLVLYASKRTLICALVVCSLATACGPDARSDVSPKVGCPECERYDAVTPGQDLQVRVEWTAWCTDDGVLPDTSSTYPCDKQPFYALARCDGAPCEFDPGTASDGGVAFDGEGNLRVRPLAAGDLTLTIALEHADTGDRVEREFSIKVREPEKLVIDCWFDSDPLGRNCTDEGSYRWCESPSWGPCTEQFALEPEGGNPLSIWIYGSAQGVPVRLEPAVSFGAFEPTHYDADYVPAHDDAAAVEEADRWSATLTSAGTYSVSARFGALQASLTTEAH